MVSAQLLVENMQHILVVDDHPIFRQAMNTILVERFKDVVTLEADSVADALEMLTGQSNVDLVMLDLNLPGSNGLSGLLDIRNAHPNIPVVVISAEVDKQQILQTISFGAAGFISKSSKIDDIADSIESIFEGNVCLPSDLLRASDGQKAASNESKISPEKIRTLTRKELLVLKHLTKGNANKVIAYELNISETTVKSHVSSILKKLGATNRVKVVAGAANIDFDQYMMR